MTTNEAAELLRAQMRADHYGEGDGGLLDDALAAERRATVERIRERTQKLLEGGLEWESFWAILDEVAAR